MRDVLLLRHLPTQSNTDDVFLGLNDEPVLTETRVSCDPGVDLGRARVLCSPLLRCRQTVGSLFTDLLGGPRQVVGWEVDVMAELTERDNGVLRGRPKQRARAEHPELFDEDVLLPWADPPASEPFAEFWARVEGVTRTIGDLAAIDGPPILICSHVYVFRALICLGLGLDVRQSWTSIRVPYGVVVPMRSFLDASIPARSNKEA